MPSALRQPVRQRGRTMALSQKACGRRENPPKYTSPASAIAMPVRAVAHRAAALPGCVWLCRPTCSGRHCQGCPGWGPGLPHGPPGFPQCYPLLVLSGLHVVSVPLPPSGPREGGGEEAFPWPTPPPPSADNHGLLTPNDPLPWDTDRDTLRRPGLLVNTACIQSHILAQDL